MSIAPNSIINGDCLEVMKDIDDRSIDCIIADLPFGITACKWDVVIPFEPLWEQYKRIIKPNGAIALFGSQPFTSALVMSNPKWFKYEWIWRKNIGGNFAQAKHRPMKEHESIIIFGGNEVRYYPVYQERSEKGKSRSKYFANAAISKKNDVYGGFRRKKQLSFTKLRLPSSVQSFNREIGQHPTQKPVALIEYLIKTYTQEGELILDNTAGSGTLAIAAINTNRNYICIEKDEHYFEVMRDRIANHDPFAPIKTKKPKPAPKGQLTLFDGGLAV